MTRTWYSADEVLAATTSAPAEIRGAETIARQFLGRAQDAQPALVNGSIGALVGHPACPVFVLSFAVANGKIIEIEAIGDPVRFPKLHLSVLVK